MSPKLAIPLHLLCLLLVAAALKPRVVAFKPKGKSPNIALPGCIDTCGGVSILYPFGIGEGCFLNPWFEVECKPYPSDYSKYGSSSKKLPFLSKLHIELMEVTIGSGPNYYYYPASSGNVIVRIPPLNTCSNPHSQQLSGIDLSGSPYNFSIIDNVFMMEGCAGSAVLVNQSNGVMAGCATFCDNSVISLHSCVGIGCCQTPLTVDTVMYSPLLFYQIDFNSQEEASDEGQNCLVGTLINNDDVSQYAGKLSSSDPRSAPPVVLLWSCPSDFDVPRNFPHASCEGNDTYFSCGCDANYEGNPYISGGCQAPEGCEGCRGYCSELGDAHGDTKFYCENRPLLNLAAILGLSNSLGMLLLAACVYGLYRFIKRRREIKRRSRFFKRNGGLLLQQQLSSNDGVIDRTKIFAITELNKATDHFNKNRILGQGGQGTVYKGMLTDGSIVAIKMSKLLDESQLEQFINEVVILSRVNHRHVVKLFGCCLETEVPLLVYEFIQNGTLFQHIHDPSEDFAISWDMRLKIAADSASAIAYLHSSSSIPIYHRDIKSSNILLDEKNRAKVSDFGSSKTIAMDQTHVTTLVQGTMGYLDPEYFQSYQFTEKSDVYSFGVVILELLTSKKPIYRDAGSMEQKNLVTEFLFLTQTSRMSNILDPKIVSEANEDELISIVELAKRCVSWSGKMRPTMKQVAMTLEMIIKSPAQVSSWYQQQEDFPIQYAGYDEFDMSGITGVEFMSNTHRAGVASPPYNDAHPLLPDA